MYQFARSLLSDETLLFRSGHDALFALLKAIGVQNGDEVILQVFTCTSVAAPIMWAGAIPIYVDIDPRSLNIDPGKIESRIGAKTKVIIVQHTFGVPAEIDAIVEIARHHGLWVIEDACHSFGSKYRGQEVGRFGDASIYSFGWHKPITLGFGGAALVNNPDLRATLQAAYREMSTPSSREQAFLYAEYLSYVLFYNPSRFWQMKEIGRRIRDFKVGPRRGSLQAVIQGQSTTAAALTDPQLENWYQAELDEAIRSASSPRGHLKGQKMPELDRMRMIQKLSRWDRVAERLRKVVARYRELLSPLGYAHWEPDAISEPVYYKLPVFLDPALKARVFKRARAVGIEMSDMFGSPVYPRERAAQWKVLGYRPGTCPVSEDVSARIVALPVNERVSSRQIERTVATLRDIRCEFGQ